MRGGDRVWLVVERELRVRLRSKVFLVSAAVLLVAALCAVIIPQIVGDDGPDHAGIAVVGGPAALPRPLAAAGRAQGLRVTATPRSERSARASVEAGDDDVAVIDGGDGAPARVLVEHDLSSRLRTVVAEGLSASRVAAALAGAGLPPAAVARLTTAPALEVVPTSGDAGPSTGDVGIGVLVAAVLYVALLSAGTVVASEVAEEKTSRVSEVLLATLRPAELLLGKTAGVGIVAIIQLVVAALPALIAAELVGAVDLPDATGSTVAWGLAWFVAGYALYATAYGALGALVGRRQRSAR